MVAVKVLHPHLASSPELARRFTAEAVIQAKLRHPNIVAVYDFVADGETLGIVMEFVDGRSLEKVISDEGGPLAPERCVALMAQEHNLVFTPHTWTNGVGVTANAHLAAGLADSPLLEFPYDPPEWSLDRRDFIMVQPLTVDAQGWINLGDAPGMGYALDEASLLRTRLG